MGLKEEIFSQSKYPELTFGGASISGEGGGYGFGQMSEKDAEKLLKSAFNHGITLFDTAPIYGFGLSEERMGRYLPKNALIVSKSGVDWHHSKRVNMSNSTEVTEKMLHQSLKRLNRDHIYLYMIHWPDSRVDIRRPMEVLKKAQEEGKIKYIGLCNTIESDYLKASEVANIDALQSELNLFNQKPFELLGHLWKGPFSMAWGTFDKGILSGRVSEKRKYDAIDCRSWAPWWDKKIVEVKIKKTDVLKKILQEHGYSLQEFCLNFNIHYFGVSTSLIGFKSESDIIQVLSSLQKSISPEKIKEIFDSWNNFFIEDF